MIVQADFDAALERVVAGMQSRRTLNDHERRVVAFHEAGHALCAELLPGVDRVHKISIVPRGRALGYTLNLPEEDRYLKTREELIDYMTMLLGGRAAEEIVFGAITTGASDDLIARRRDLARDGPRVRDGHDDHLAQGLRRGRRWSPTARASCATRSSSTSTDEAMRGAAKLILEHREKLDELAAALLRNEVLERSDIDRIMAGTPRLERRAARAARGGDRADPAGAEARTRLAAHPRPRPRVPAGEHLAAGDRLELLERLARRRPRRRSAASRRSASASRSRSRARWASPCRRAPPPASRMPWMRMSEDSSGGVWSSVSRTASTICCTWLGERRADVVGVEHHRAREAREQLAAADLDLDRLGHRERGAGRRS